MICHGHKKFMLTFSVPFFGGIAVIRLFQVGISIWECFPDDQFDNDPDRVGFIKIRMFFKL